MWKPFNPDVHASIPPVAAASSAMVVIDALQRGYHPEVQAHGIAAAFILLAERFGVDPADLFAKTTNLMNHAEGRRPEFAAVAQYMEKEL